MGFNCSERSGLMTYGGFTLALLERMDTTSVDLFSVIKIALGWPIGLNLRGKRLN